MKLLALVFLVGFALASAVPVPSHDLSLKEDDLEYMLALAAEDGEDATELGKKLREKFDKILEKMKDTIEEGKTITEETIEKLKNIREEMKEKHVELGKKAKEMIEKLKEIAKDYWKKILDKLTGKDKEAFMMADEALAMEQRSIGFKENLKKLRDLIRDKVDFEAIKLKIEEFFVKKSEFFEHLLDKLKDKSEEGRERLLKWIDNILEDKKEKRSIKDVYEKIKNYFKDLNIELKEKFVKFGEWAKQKYEEGLEKGKDRAENIKKLAKEFIDDAKVKGKDVAEQAKEFFREYKDDLGIIYDDVSEKVKEILSKH